MDIQIRNKGQHQTLNISNKGGLSINFAFANRQFKLMHFPLIVQVQVELRVSTTTFVVPFIYRPNAAIGTD